MEPLAIFLYILIGLGALAGLWFVLVAGTALYVIFSTMGRLHSRRKMHHLRPFTGRRR